MSKTKEGVSLKLAKCIAALIEDKRGQDVVVLDLRGVTSYTDFFVICTARNERQVKALHDHLVEGLKAGRPKVIPQRTEGTKASRWVLIDYLDVVVHIFTEETRQFYRLERLWGEAPRIELGEAVALEVN